MDRLFWVSLSRLWRDWRSTLVLVEPETVVAIGSIRGKCLDHVIVFDEGSLRRILASYFDYYHRSRTHLSLSKDSLEPRPMQAPDMGPVVAISQVGGLHLAMNDGPPETAQVRAWFCSSTRSSDISV